MPLDPEWWDGTTGPFRDNGNGEISAATLRTFALHLNSAGIPSGWAQFMPESVVLPDDLLPGGDGSGLVLLKAPAGSSGAPLSPSTSTPGLLSLPSGGRTVVDVALRGLVTLDNLPGDRLIGAAVVAVGNVIGAEAHTIGQPVAVNADGAAYLDVSRHIVLDTDGGVDLLIGIGIFDVGDWGDPSNGDAVTLTDPDDAFEPTFSVSVIVTPATDPS